MSRAVPGPSFSFAISEEREAPLAAAPGTEGEAAAAPPSAQLSSGLTLH